MAGLLSLRHDASLKYLGEDGQAFGSRSSMKPRVPHRHRHVFTRKQISRCEMQRVQRRAYEAHRGRSTWYP
jgi:hypothetical protein